MVLGIKGCSSSHAHPQVGPLKGFNSNFLINIPILIIWDNPRLPHEERGVDVKLIWYHPQKT